MFLLFIRHVHTCKFWREENNTKFTGYAVLIAFHNVTISSMTFLTKYMNLLDMFPMKNTIIHIKC